MSKYIKLEDAENEINHELEWYKDPILNPCLTVALECIKSLPTIDIVNCIECDYLGEDWWCYKHEFTPIPIEDYFCKDGERIEK